MTSSRRTSVARFNRRNRLVTAKGRPRPFLNTPHGQKLTRELFLDPLADFLAGKHESASCFLSGNLKSRNSRGYRSI